MSSRDWVYQKFCEYYTGPSYKFPSPAEFSQREYAFLLFRERAMVRHKAFSTPTALSGYLKDKIPSDVYHSCAYYETPEADMDKKGWMGADLVFDIDADHIPTSCGKLHDEWHCANPRCLVSGGLNGRGITPDECPACGGVKFETRTWACDQCIETTRVETQKLLDMLANDFGFSEHEIHTYFSGHRGYHIHVENEAIRNLDAMARKEIVDYVSGKGIDLFNKKGSSSAKAKRKEAAPVFSLGDYGWRRRLKSGLQSFLEVASNEDLLKTGITNQAANSIFKHKSAILRHCFLENRWKNIKGTYDNWIKLAEYIKDRQISQIDTVVTSDIHRLIRANGTLHGKTGLLKAEFPVRKLDCFDPFVGAVAFKEGTAQIHVHNAPQFRMSGETFGPYRDEIKELPTAAAVMLVLKGRADVMQ